MLPDHGTLPNLASRALGRVLRRLSADWEARWGDPLLAVETFVDESLCRGTCYRACGFEALGATAGFGRSARDSYEEHGRAKTLYLQELRPGARALLRQPRLPAELRGHEDELAGPCPYRDHWSAIESGTHPRRDVTFGEDRRRVAHRSAEHVLAALRNLANGFYELEAARGKAGADGCASWRRRWRASDALAMPRRWTRRGTGARDGAGTAGQSSAATGPCPRSAHNRGRRASSAPGIDDARRAVAPDPKRVAANGNRFPLPRCR